MQQNIIACILNNDFINHLIILIRVILQSQSLSENLASYDPLIVTAIKTLEESSVLLDHFSLELLH